MINRISSNAGSAPRTPKVSRVGDGLSFTGNPQRADFADFQQAIAELKNLRAHTVSIDLSRVTYASSMFIGALVDAVSDLKAQDKEVQIQVSPDLGRFLNMAHLYHLFDYTIVVSEVH